MKQIHKVDLMPAIQVYVIIHGRISNMGISACLVIRNEEKTLERCLASISKVVNEIIVVHDGECTDNSLTIAQKFKARIFVKTFIGEAEHHRPFAFKQAAGDWILQIDADEFLPKETQKELRHLIEQKNVDGFCFWWPYFVNGSYIKRGPFSQTIKPCLFRKSKMYMLGISHEYPRTYGKFSKRLNLQVEHKPYTDNFTFNNFQKKWIRWASLQAKQIYRIEQVPFYNIPSQVVEHGISYYKFMRSHPLISGVVETVRFILLYLSRGLILAGFKSWQIAAMELVYLWLVRINLLKLKYVKR